MLEGMQEVKRLMTLILYKYIQPKHNALLLF